MPQEYDRYGNLIEDTDAEVYDRYGRQIGGPKPIGLPGKEPYNPLNFSDVLNKTNPKDLPIDPPPGAVSWDHPQSQVKPYFGTTIDEYNFNASHPPEPEYRTLGQEATSMAFRTVPSIAGSWLGRGGGLLGQAVGGGLGGFVGEGAGEIYDWWTDPQFKGFNPTQMVTQGAISAIPFAGPSAKFEQVAQSKIGREAVKYAIKSAGQTALQGGAVGAVSTIPTQLAETGELPTWGQVGRGGAYGAVLGGLTGGVLGGAKGASRYRNRFGQIVDDMPNIPSSGWDSTIPEPDQLRLTGPIEPPPPVEPPSAPRPPVNYGSGYQGVLPFINEISGNTTPDIAPPPPIPPTIRGLLPETNPRTFVGHPSGLTSIQGQPPPLDPNDPSRFPQTMIAGGQPTYYTPEERAALEAENAGTSLTMSPPLPPPKEPLRPITLGGFTGGDGIPFGERNRQLQIPNLEQPPLPMEMPPSDMPTNLPNRLVVRPPDPVPQPETPGPITLGMGGGQGPRFGVPEGGNQLQLPVDMPGPVEPPAPVKAPTGYEPMPAEPRPESPEGPLTPPGIVLPRFNLPRRHPRGPGGYDPNGPPPSDITPSGDVVPPFSRGGGPTPKESKPGVPPVERDEALANQLRDQGWSEDQIDELMPPPETGLEVAPPTQRFGPPVRQAPKVEPPYKFSDKPFHAHPGHQIMFEEDWTDAIDDANLLDIDWRKYDDLDKLNAAIAEKEKADYVAEQLQDRSHPVIASPGEKFDFGADWTEAVDEAQELGIDWKKHESLDSLHGAIDEARTAQAEALDKALGNRDFSVISKARPGDPPEIAAKRLALRQANERVNSFDTNIKNKADTFNLDNAGKYLSRDEIEDLLQTIDDLRDYDIDSLGLKGPKSSSLPTDLEKRRARILGETDIDKVAGELEDVQRDLDFAKSNGDPGEIARYEKLKGEVEDHFDSIVDGPGPKSSSGGITKLIRRFIPKTKNLKALDAKLEKFYNGLEPIPGYLEKPFRQTVFMAPGGRLTPAELNRFKQSPLINQVASIIDVALEMITKLAVSPAGAAKLQKVGLILAKPNYYGLTASKFGPGDEQTTSITLSLFSHLNSAGVNGPEDFARNVIGTIAHEAAHLDMHDPPTVTVIDPADLNDPEAVKFLDVFRNEVLGQGFKDPHHEMDFIRRLGDIYGRAGLRRFDQLKGLLVKSIAEKDANGTWQYNQEFRDLLQIYNEGLGRRGTEEDLLEGIGVLSDSPRNRRGSTKGDGKDAGAEDFRQGKRARIVVPKTIPGTPVYPPRNQTAGGSSSGGSGGGGKSGGGGRRSSGGSPKTPKVNPPDEPGLFSRIGRISHGLKATGDLGPSLRQGKNFAGRPAWNKAFAQQFVSYASKQKHENYLRKLSNSKLHKKETRYADSDGNPRSWAEKFGLDADISGAPNVYTQEEQTMGMELAEHFLRSGKLPVVKQGGQVLGNLVNRSNRSYNAFISGLRTGVAEVLHTNYSKLYESLKKTAVTAAEKAHAEKMNPDGDYTGFKIADEVNQASGRSKLTTKERRIPEVKFFGKKMGGQKLISAGDALERNAHHVNTWFFALRNLKSNVEQMIKIGKLVGTGGAARGDKVMRNEHIKQMISYAALAGGLSQMYRLFGAVNEWDPRSSDFMHSRWGRFKSDFSGGIASAATLFARILTGETKTRNGEIIDLTNPANTFQHGDLMDKVEEFGEGKVSPGVAMLMALTNRKERFTPRKQPLNVTSPSPFENSFMRIMATPISWQNIADVMEADPGMAPLIFMDLIGGGVSVEPEEEP